MKLSHKFSCLLTLLTFFGLPCLGHGWFGIPEDWDEVEVERAAVAGVCLSDSVCDITGARVVDPDAGYRAKRVAPGRYVVREKKQRYFFEERGDSLLWTGYENRLIRSLGSGAPVALPGSGPVAGGEFSHSGKYALTTEINENGFLRSERWRVTLVCDGDTIRDAEAIATERASMIGDSVSATPIVERSLRIYGGGCPHALVELRGLSQCADSAAVWDQAFVLSRVLDNGLETEEQRLEAPAKPAASDSRLSASADGACVTLGFDSPQAGLMAEVTLCSLSGIVYHSETVAAAVAGPQSVRIPASGIPPGRCLAAVRVGDEPAAKTIVDIK